MVSKIIFRTIRGGEEAEEKAVYFLSRILAPAPHACSATALTGHLRSAVSAFRSHSLVPSVLKHGSVSPVFQRG